jgi:hypothetical protein
MANKMDGTIASKLAKVNEDITVRRADNGWLVEFGGRTRDDEWKHYKIVCTQMDEVVTLVMEHSAVELDN